VILSDFKYNTLHV